MNCADATSKYIKLYSILVENSNCYNFHWNIVHRYTFIPIESHTNWIAWLECEINEFENSNNIHQLILLIQYKLYNFVGVTSFYILKYILSRFITQTFVLVFCFKLNFSKVSKNIYIWIIMYFWIKESIILIATVMILFLNS